MYSFSTSVSFSALVRILGTTKAPSIAVANNAMTAKSRIDVARTGFDQNPRTLLSNRENLSTECRKALKTLLAANKRLNTSPMHGAGCLQYFDGAHATDSSLVWQPQG